MYTIGNFLLGDLAVFVLVEILEGCFEPRGLLQLFPGHKAVAVRVVQVHGSSGRAGWIEAWHG
jgi:hypothetical protein